MPLVRRLGVLGLFLLVACSSSPSLTEHAKELAYVDRAKNVAPYVRVLTELDAKCSQDAGKITDVVETDVGFLGQHGRVSTELEFMRQLLRSPGSDCQANGLAIVNFNL